jgi:TPP-dependent pyruvate/acetoin dehydrogenase alpha subunit
MTLRMEGHAVHDDAFYVPSELHSAWAAQDPVQRYRAFLLEQTGFTAQEDEELRAGVKAELGEALRRAEASPLPDAASVVDGVYA